MGKQKWCISLRKGDSFKGIRGSYINIGSDKRPYWVVTSPIRRQNEMIVRPGCDPNAKKGVDFIKNPYLPKDTVNQVKSVGKLSCLKGEKLYEVEFNREMSCKKKKILHKAFIENGKIILDQDINHIFGEETFYKNYQTERDFHDDSQNGSVQYYSTNMIGGAVEGYYSCRKRSFYEDKKKNSAHSSLLD